MAMFNSFFYVYQRAIYMISHGEWMMNRRRVRRGPRNACQKRVMAHRALFEVKKPKAVPRWWASEPSYHLMGYMCICIYIYILFLHYYIILDYIILYYIRLYYIILDYIILYSV